MLTADATTDGTPASYITYLRIRHIYKNYCARIIL
jgi:hypothetical protein